MIVTKNLESKFARIGARLKLGDLNSRTTSRRLASGIPFSLDIQSDRRGEFFEVIDRYGTLAEVEVLDVQPTDRHLLLMVRDGGEKYKFLCGHDERHWFVAAVPESAPVGTVHSAKEALKPQEVKTVQARLGLSSRSGNRRKNAAFRRQGEWFFVPALDLKVDPRLVLRDEPITRGNSGKPHWTDYCYRIGGQTVYVCRRYPNGVDVSTYQRLLNEDQAAKNWGWQTMVRDASVYVHGRIRHADHKTIVLHE